MRLTVADGRPQPKLTIVNTTSRDFDDLNRRSIRSHAAAFGRQRQREAKAKRLIGKPPIRMRRFRETWEDGSEKNPAVAERRGLVAPIRHLGNGLDPFLALPQSIVEMNRAGSLDKVKAHMFHVFRQPASQRIIIPEAIRDPTFFTSLLLLAFSHYDAMTNTGPSPEAISIKIENIRQINQQLAIPHGVAKTPTICSIMCLSGATTAYEMDALWDYKLHRNAIAMLVEFAGGIEVLKQTQLGFCMAKMMVLRDQVEASAWSSPYRDFPKSCLDPLPPFAQTIKKSGRVWKSPFYEPPFEFSTHRIFCDLQLATRIILLNVRTFIHLLEKEDLEDRSEFENMRNQIRKSIRMAPPLASASPRMRAHQDYVYECCRLTALIMLEAEEHSSSLRLAVEHTSLLEDLCFALRRTDTENFWNGHVGLLFWVTIISNAAAFHTKNHLFTTTILTNLMFEACYSDYDLDVALVPTEKMIWFENYCKSGQTVLPLR